MRAEAFQRWIDHGVLPPPDGDGRWSPDIWPRVDAAIALTKETRTLARRAFRLQLLGFPFPPAAARKASSEVLRRIRRPSGKMTQVRREYDAFARRARGLTTRGHQSFRHPLSPERWSEPLCLARDSVFQREFELAGRYARMAPDVAREAGVKQSLEIPYEERFVLLLVDQLLRDPFVRNKMKLQSLTRIP
jgi:hypothetical protein